MSLKFKLISVIFIMILAVTDITNQVKSGSNEMASGAQQINVAVNHVNDISGKTREGINTLINEVSRF